MNDEDYKQLIQNYNQKQLIIGWNICFNLGRMILSFVIITLYIFYDKSYPEFWSVVISRPLLFIFIFICDNAIKKYPIILDYIFSFLLLIFGLLFTYENIKDPYPKFFEMWYIFNFVSLLAVLSQCVQWKKLVIAFWISKIICITAMCFTYKTRIPYYIFSVTMLSMITYPVLCLLICKIIFDILKLLHKNRKLIDTTKNILEIFPEGVIIRSLDSQHNKTITNFTNHSINQDFELSDNTLNEIGQTNVQISICNEKEEEKNNQEKDRVTYNLNDLLELCEYESEISK